MVHPKNDGGIENEIMSRHGHSAQPESQQLVAVLQALQEVIAAEGLPATPTSYFAAAMSALEKPETRSSAQVRRSQGLPDSSGWHCGVPWVGCSAALCFSLLECMLPVHQASCACVGSGP